eukprot:Colp12_sorted_trinity150504_noHs@21783
MADTNINANASVTWMFPINASNVCEDAFQFAAMLLKESNKDLHLQGIHFCQQSEQEKLPLNQRAAHLVSKYDSVCLDVKLKIQGATNKITYSINSKELGLGATVPQAICEAATVTKADMVVLGSTNISRRASWASTLSVTKADNDRQYLTSHPVNSVAYATLDPITTDILIVKAHRMPGKSERLKVLVAVNETAAAETAFFRAIEFAKSGLRLDILVVNNNQQAAVPVVKKYTELLAEFKLDGTVHEFAKETGITVAQQISNIADEMEAHLVVVGYERRIGSIAKFVALNAPCNVMIVKAIPMPVYKAAAGLETGAEIRVMPPSHLSSDTSAPSAFK